MVCAELMFEREEEHVPKRLYMGGRVSLGLFDPVISFHRAQQEELEQAQGGGTEWHKVGVCHPYPGRNRCWFYLPILKMAANTAQVSAVLINYSIRNTAST